MDNKVIFGVSAHADDLEVNCAGTLAKYTKMNCKVFMCNVFIGDKASAEGEKSNNEVSEIRKKEAYESASVIGAELIFGLGVGDGEINYIEKDLNDKLIDLLRYIKPDIVITHPPIDYVHDHNITSQLVFNAVHFCGVERYKTKNKAIPKSPRIYFMDPITGINFNPYEYVDITDTYEIKIEMLSKFKSQLAFIGHGSGFHNTDIIEMARITSEFRGLQCGVKYAEAFNRDSAWLRVTPQRDLP